MPIAFRIMPEHGLVYVRHDGHITLAENLESFMDYTRHPECRPGQIMLIDLSRVTDFDADFVRFFDLQAKAAEYLGAEGNEGIAIFVAPTAVSRRMARMAQKSWEDVQGVTIPMVENEADAIALLHLRVDSLSDLVGEGD